MRKMMTRSLLAGIAGLGLAACGGSSGERADNGPPPVEVPPNANAPDIADRTANGDFAVTYIVLDGSSFDERSTIQLRGNTGVLTGGELDGEDVDDLGIFTNPATGDFSRIVRISADNLFGVVGIAVPANDLPAAGTMTSYNEGWVGLTATFDNDVLVLTGDATFDVDWASGGGTISGTLSNFNVDSSATGNRNGNGTIVFTNGVVNGDDFSFAPGTISGTGTFSGLGGSNTTSQTQGTFFGAGADELGGVIVIDDRNDDITVTGAFQAD